MTLVCSRTALWRRSLIHHDAYVLSLKPLEASKVSSARSSPWVPSAMRSDIGMPALRYLAAKDVTRPTLWSSTRVFACLPRRKSCGRSL